MTQLLYLLLQLLIMITFVDVILSYFPDVRRYGWAQSLRRVADIFQRPIREKLPRDIPLDPSPIIIIIGCRILMALL